jgi:L-ascorbate metabolism protein UlaG (beta-lactamase superfamily)
MNAEDALRALPILGAEQMLPMHYGTFPASFEAADQPLKQLVRETQRRGWTERVRILQDGDSLSLTKTRLRDAATPWGASPGLGALATA